jgi:hypothetical protein
MRDDFAVLILTHGRADRVKTIDALARAGYTGKIYLVIDNEDKTADDYRARYGDQVLMFDKAAVAQTFDEGDNFNDRRSIIYARNASFDLAQSVGIKYFVQFDDDYTGFQFRFQSAGVYGTWTCTTLEQVFDAMIDFFEATPITTVAMAQGADHIGGWVDVPRARRKAMNSFLCSTDRRFTFTGRLNEDVNTYTSKGSRGAVFLTILGIMLRQTQTQSNAGGLTEMYRDGGTYLKSFYTVMYQPSSVKIGEMGDHRSPSYRIHHKIDWPKTVPMILSPEHRKPRPL